MTVRNEPKIVLGLLLYFVLLTFIVTMITGIASHYGLSSDGFNSSGGGLGADTFPIGSGNPRFDTGVVGGVQSFFSARVLHDVSATPFIQAGYITDQTSCEQYEGFEWGQFSFLWWNLGAETCRGNLDTSFYDPQNEWDRGNSFSVYANDYVCDLPLLSTDQSLALSFGCTWYTGGINPEFQLFESRSVFSNIWNSMKQIVTFQVSFGIQNTALNLLLNFLLLGLPLLILILYLIILGRKLLGWT